MTEDYVCALTFGQLEAELPHSFQLYHGAYEGRLSRRSSGRVVSDKANNPSHVHPDADVVLTLGPFQISVNYNYQRHVNVDKRAGTEVRHSFLPHSCKTGSTKIPRVNTRCIKLASDLNWPEQSAQSPENLSSNMISPAVAKIKEYGSEQAYRTQRHNIVQTLRA